MYSYNPYEYPISSARDEPLPSSMECHSTIPEHSTRPARARASEAYPVQIHREVAPGILSDGTITIRHPCVSAYLDGLARDFGKTLDAAGSSNMVVHGSVHLGRVEDVSKVLGLELNVLQSECILALAALRVYYDVHHAAHFALWGKSVKVRTEEVVRKIYYHAPRVISSPICWMGARENLWLLNTQQLLAFPEELRDRPKERPERKMTLRQRTGKRRPGSTGAVAATPVDTGDSDVAPPPAVAPEYIPLRSSKHKLIKRPDRRIPQAGGAQPRMQTRWFKSQRGSREGTDGSVGVSVSVDVDMDEVGDAEARGVEQRPEPEEHGPSMEAAPAVLLDVLGGRSMNGEETMKMEGTPSDSKAVAEVIRHEPTTRTASAPLAREDPPSTSTSAQATTVIPAPTRRSSRQATKRRAVEAVMAGITPGSGSATPVGFPSRGSSTAVSDVSERTAVEDDPEEPRAEKARKRKASAVDAEGAQATEEQAVEGPSPAEEEHAPRKKAKRTHAQTTMTLTAAETEPATSSAATGTRKAKPRTTTGGRKRRR